MRRLGRRLENLRRTALAAGLVALGAAAVISLWTQYGWLVRVSESYPKAYREAMAFTGKVVALVGITLASGVITWAFSPIKFQADMGLMLTFMFIVNMFGALWLLPALARFLIKPEKLAGKASGSLLAH